MKGRIWIFTGLTALVIVVAALTVVFVTGSMSHETPATGDHVMSATGDHAMPATTGDHDTTTSFASITATPESGNAPLVVSFRAVDLAHAMFGAATKYSWDFGGGAKADGLTAEHTYTQKGKYTVTLTIVFQDGTLEADTKVIQVK